MLNFKAEISTCALFFLANIVLNIQYQQLKSFVNMKGFQTSLTTLKPSDNKYSPRIQGKKLLTEDNHEVTDYGLLNKAVNNRLQRKKKKKTEIFSDCVSHCHSLDKLQLLNLEKNEEIKRHIYEKAEIHAQNQQLKQMITNPTLRQHQLHMKINQLQQANKRLTFQLQRKQRDHNEEIERLRSEHKKQIQLINEGYKLRNQIAYQRPTQTVEIKQQYVRNNEPNIPNIRVIENTKPTVSFAENKVYQNVTNFSQRTKNQPIKMHQVQNKNDNVKNYIAGSPVYISANKPIIQQKKVNYISNKSFDQTKPFVRQAGSSPDSKNTTSQTRIYHADSPKIISSAHEANISQGITRMPSKPTQVRYQPQKATENRYEPQKISQGKYEIKSYDQKYISLSSRPNDNNMKYTKINQVNSKTTLPIGYGENDLQEIYKKYCIND